MKIGRASLRVLSFVSVFLLAVFGCGKKSSPRPPMEIAPGAVKFFVASGTVEGVMLSWLSPTTTLNGRALDELAGFKVYRSEINEDKKMGDFVEISDISFKSSNENFRYQYLDKDVKPKLRYDYYVVAYDTKGDRGVLSQVLEVTYVGTSSVVIGRNTP